LKKVILNFLKIPATNLKTIIFAFVLSIIIWFAISFQLFPDVIRNIDMPVTAHPSDYDDMTENSLELSEEFSGMVTARIQGKRYDIGGLRAEDFTAFLDLSSVKDAGEHTVNVVIKPVTDGIKCDVLSDNITKNIKVIQTAEVTLDVVPSAEGIEAVEGMRIDYDNLDVTPKTVKISGEKSLVDLVTRAEVRAVYGDVLTVTAEDLRGELILYGKNGVKLNTDDIYIENSSFHVTVPVFKLRTVPVKVLIDAPSNFNLDSLYDRMSVDPEELTISSPDSSIDNFENIIELSLNELTLNDLQAGCSVEFEIPQTYTNLTGKNYALLTFDDVDYYGSMFFEVSAENFNARNTPQGYEVKYITQQISVNVVGPSSFIHSLSSADFRATVDLLGIDSEGTRTIGANFRLALADAEAWVVGEYKINIDIIKTEE
jgi:YbbR domain-containing protein